jgi:hypothetical protein
MKVLLSQNISLLRMSKVANDPLNFCENQGHLFYLRAMTLLAEAASTSETSVNFYQTARHNYQEDIFILAAMRT